MLTKTCPVLKQPILAKALALLCAFSLVYAPVQNTPNHIAPKSSVNGTYDDSDPLTHAFLNKAAKSPDPNTRELAKLILSQQKTPFSGVIISFAAAFFASFPFIGQEIILKKTTIWIICFCSRSSRF